MTKPITEQGSLFGGSPEDTERLLVLAMLPERAGHEAAEVRERLKRSHGLGGGEVRADRLHVTMIHIGDYAGALPPRVVEEARAVLDRLTAGAVDIALDRVGSFAGQPGRYPLVLTGEEGVGALKALRRDLWKALRLGGVRMLSTEAFNPHVTLMYAHARLAEQAIAPIGWRATELELVHSKLGRTVYETLGRYPLT